MTIAPGSSFVEPGITPLLPTPLLWATFSQAVDEAGRSRRMGGIHFPDADLQGRALGSFGRAERVGQGTELLRRHGLGVSGGAPGGGRAGCAGASLPLPRRRPVRGPRRPRAGRGGPAGGGGRLQHAGAARPPDPAARAGPATWRPSPRHRADADQRLRPQQRPPPPGRACPGARLARRPVRRPARCRDRRRLERARVPRDRPAVRPGPGPPGPPRRGDHGAQGLLRRGRSRSPASTTRSPTTTPTRSRSSGRTRRCSSAAAAGGR